LHGIDRKDRGLGLESKVMLAVVVHVVDARCQVIDYLLESHGFTDPLGV
jgi:hypothetical protein